MAFDPTALDHAKETRLEEWDFAGRRSVSCSEILEENVESRAECYTTRHTYYSLLHNSVYVRAVDVQTCTAQLSGAGGAASRQSRDFGGVALISRLNKVFNFRNAALMTRSDPVLCTEPPCFVPQFASSVAFIQLAGALHNWDW